MNIIKTTTGKSDKKPILSAIGVAFRLSSKQMENRGFTETSPGIFKYGIEKGSKS